MCVEDKYRILGIEEGYYEIFSQPAIGFCTYLKDDFLLGELENWFDQRDLTREGNSYELLKFMKGWLDDGIIDDKRLTLAVRQIPTKCPRDAGSIPRRLAVGRPRILRNFILCALGMVMIEYGKSIGRFGG